VAIFQPEIIASVANINPRNIVQLSHMSIFSLISNHQKGIIIQTKIKQIFIINSAFFIKSGSLSLLNKITHKKKSIKNDIIDNPEVFPCIQSVQFSALKTNTYQRIVKNKGIR